MPLIASMFIIPATVESPTLNYLLITSAVGCFMFHGRFPINICGLYGLILFVFVSGNRTVITTSCS